MDQPSQPAPDWLKPLESAYPGAMPFAELIDRSSRLLRDAGFTPEGTLLANAICRDELNKAALVQLQEAWGENFELAGLGGFPSAGRTGFGAYAAHVPTGGALFVVYGAHIGISRTGVLGETERPGMDQPTGACGALLALQSRLDEDAAYSPSFDMDDPEQYVLERSILEANPDLARRPHDVVALTDAAQAVIHQRVLDLARPTRGERPVILLGGVTINTTLGADEYFEPRHAEIWSPDGTSRDWLDDVRR